MQISNNDNRHVDKRINSTENQAQNDNNLSINEILSILVGNKWLIALSILVCLAFGIVKAFTDPPIYKSTALLQVEPHAISASLATDEPLQEFEIPIAAEIELLNSNATIEKVIQKFNMDITAYPIRFPGIGEIIAKRFDKNNKNNSILNNFLGYAWGGESIRIDDLVLPAYLLDEPLILKANPLGHFQVTYENEIILEGEVGGIASRELKNQESISLLVSSLRADPNTKFKLMKLSRDTAIKNFQSVFKAIEKGKLTRIIELSYESNDRKSAKQILNEVINVHLHQSLELKSSGTQSSLEFLESQLPLIKQKLNITAAALNSFRAKTGTVNLDLETQNLLQGSVRIETEISVLQQKLDQLRQHFTVSHPSVIAINKQIVRLQEQKKFNEHKIEALPSTQKEILKLSREVEVNTAFYSLMLNKIQALHVEKDGTISDIRVIDYASLPGLTVKPKKSLIILVSLVLGLILGVVMAFLIKAIQRGVDDPDLIEKLLYVPVMATIPNSTNQGKIQKKIISNIKNEINGPIILALQNKFDLAIEGLRGLRTTLHSAFFVSHNNIIMITGPTSGVGTTFVSINFAIVLADAGKKILLIDGDLRKGYINKILGLDRGNGLSDIISSTPKEWPYMLESVIHKIPIMNLDFISTGSIPPNPSELLFHQHFGVFLEHISKNYDHVIIDSPPILAVTDAAIIGGKASVILMVVKSGKHTINDLKQCVKRFNLAGLHLKGIVLNN